MVDANRRLRVEWVFTSTSWFAGHATQAPHEAQQVAGFIQTY
jgi:hypothetical protein